MMVVKSGWTAGLVSDGYVVVAGLVPETGVEAVTEDIWRHIDATPGDRESWYRSDLVSKNGMVEMYHYQSMWDNRQQSRVHEVFNELLGTPRLWVSLDRANFKPPAHPAHPEFDTQGFIHWDEDSTRYPDIPCRLQGVLALEDTDESMGGFQCVPELYRDLPEWIARQPTDRDARVPDLTGYSITPIPLRAGEMVIWNSLLPHGNGRNRSGRPRLAQYITMYPARDEAERLERIRCWRENRPEAWAPGDPRKIEEKRDQPAALTELGRKLLGLDSW
jgi:ectoine hydroxylase-related dioxygenase (phytanoyl-CoA dioxygenase family)